MDVINLEDYDLSYEIQYIAFMITILKSYITFNFENDNYGLKVLKIYINNQDPPLEEELTETKYIHFIQHTFPDIINNEIKITEERWIEKDIQKKIFNDNYLDGFSREIDYRGKDRVHFDIFKKMDPQKIKEQIPYYVNSVGTKSTLHDILTGLSEKITYLEELRNINKEKNGSIKDVIQFLENLKYYRL